MGQIIAKTSESYLEQRVITSVLPVDRGIFCEGVDHRSDFNAQNVLACDSLKVCCDSQMRHRSFLWPLLQVHGMVPSTVCPYYHHQVLQRDQRSL
jgi:hypothetical protein